MTLLVFGMDGAVDQYVQEAIDRGLMPNLEKVISEGAYGDLKSTVPPVTLPSWVSMFSGLGPDTIDMFYMKQMDENYSESPVPSERWKGKMLWDRLDGRFGLINVPGTSPVYPVEGYMFEGFPMVMDPSTYPDDMEDELPEMDLKRKDEQSTKNLRRKALIHNFRERREVFSEISEDVDVRVEVYQLTDTAAHRSKNKDQILESYGMVDEVLGERMEEYDDILLVSDHGFKHIDRMFYPNKWLKDEGYLVSKDAENTEDSVLNQLRDLLTPLAETPLRPYLKWLNDILRSNTSVDFSPKGGGTEEIEFSKTQAFSFRGSGSSYGDININDSRFSSPTVEDTETIREEIKKSLEQEEIIDRVWRSEEVYDSPENMPDLVFKTIDRAGVGVSVFSKAVFKTDAFIHSDTGIVAARGSSFRDGSIDAEIVDIAPTVARYLGQDLDCDGETIDIFSDSFEPKQPSESELSSIDV